MGEIVRHQGRGQGEGMCGDVQVHGADGLPGLFQGVPDAAIVGGAGHPIEIEHLEGRQDLPDGGDLRVIVAAVVGPNSSSETVMAERPTASPFS